MRKIVTTTMVTLDGVMQAPGESKEDESEGFKYGGWQEGWDEEADEITDRIMLPPFDMLLGRVTYEIFASYWPNHKEEPRWGKPFDKAKKYVVSRYPLKVSWPEYELITGDVTTLIKNLKNSDGRDLWVWGSGKLIQTLLKNDLIDRMYIWTFPVSIGTGKKLFAEGTLPKRLKIVDSKITSTGIIFAAYEFTAPLPANSQ